jgi:DNA-directed RNA polymerase subunit L
MAKKKIVKSNEETENEIDEIEDDLMEEEIEGIYPKLKKEKSTGLSTEETEMLEPSEEDLEYEMEEQIELPTYKYLDLKLNKASGINDYELIIEGQSHGFCNIFVKHLLMIEGVNIAAYKVTGLEFPKIFIRVEDSKKYNIKEILNKGIESLREEVEEVQKVFKKLM